MAYSINPAVVINKVYLYEKLQLCVNLRFLKEAIRLYEYIE